jgi:hypothetical protein
MAPGERLRDRLGGTATGVADGSVRSMPAPRSTACSSDSSGSSTSSDGTGGATGGSSAATSFLPASLTGPSPSSVKIGLAGGYSIQFMPTVLAMGAGYYQQVANRFHTQISFDDYASGTPAEAAFFGGTDQQKVRPISASSRGDRRREGKFAGTTNTHWVHPSPPPVGRSEPQAATWSRLGCCHRRLWPHSGRQRLDT